MVNSTLDAFQEEFLRRFFSRKSGFFLTGGGALAGFYLGYRATKDLDLFTLSDEIEKGFDILREVAGELGAEIESLQTSPDFRRILVSRSDAAIVVDLVREYVFQVEEKKSVINGIRVDTPEEIFANKLTALLSRSEIRDVTDIYHLERAGYDLSPAVASAERKDTGFSPAQLAWVLNSITIGDDAILPGGLSVTEARGYIAGLIKRLQVMALPDEA